MPIGVGARLGSYEVVAALGSGGMGQVYRAHDTKLGRDVALKILPESFVHDPDRVARFRREAQVLASLNNPHIAAIYGLEEAHGAQFLVLELTPAPIRKLLRRCLAKDGKQRLPDAADARLEIDEAQSAVATDVASAAVPLAARRPLGRFGCVHGIEVGRRVQSYVDWFRGGSGAEPPRREELRPWELVLS